MFKELVVQAVTAVLIQLNPSAIDQYFSPNYIQHSAQVADGPPALKAFVTSLKQNPRYRYEPVRVIAEGPFVLLHGRYTGFGDQPTAAFDLFRVENGRIAEHWDALQPEPQSTVSGHTMLDGPTQVADVKLTARNKAHVSGFVKDVLVGGQFDKLTHYISTETYIQHNPNIADGLKGLGEAVENMGKAGIKMEYKTVHRVVAEGNLVFTQSEGKLGGKPTAYYDLFRVENGKIVEHWDVVQEIPATLPHGNGLF
jgi:predicted SnoaL-like aldol condensation-catalyzing enzyme